jgi:transcription initiation factor TFIIB
MICDIATGDLICSHCGLIVRSNSIDQRAEWRAFDLEEFDKKARVGAPSTLTLHDKGLSTIIDWRDRDAMGKKLSPQRRAEAYRLRKWQIRMRVHSSLDRNLAYAMNELDRLSSQLGIQRMIKESAAIIYRRSIDKKLIRGRSIEAMIAASIYTACRIASMPRTLDEFALNTRIEKRDLGRCFRLILRELQLHIPTPRPINFISRFGNDLHISNATQQSAIIILERAKKFGLIAGKDPTGLAAASIYIAALSNGERKTQREIAKVANITEVTVRNRYKDLCKYLHLHISN